MAGQQLRCALPRLLPTGTRIAHKTGAGPSNESDVGVIYRGDTPLFAACVYAHHIPIALKDGRSGRGLALDHISEVALACWRVLAAD
jgi:beta-lactamase class A